jgi:ABC-type sugar transport system ATPase subunit
VLGGPSGAGKSSILKMLYGNYGVEKGQILVCHNGEYVDLATADPRTVIAIRRDTIGYVSQFLRVVPRVSALDVAAEPLVQHGVDPEEAREKAAALFSPSQPAGNAVGTCRRRPSRAANSSASTSRAASSPTIRSFCSTSRRPRSTPGTAKSSSR